MGAYSIVLAPIASILAADYFLVKKQKYHVIELYNPHGIYYCASLPPPFPPSSLLASLPSP